MGKLAGAAATVAVPEAAAARKITPGTSVEQTRAELQRRRRAAAQASTARRAGTAPAGPSSSAAPSPTSPGGGAAASTSSTPPAPATPAPAGGVSLPSLPTSGAVQTSSGFLLGLFLWGWVGLPYLRGGAPEVRRTLAAKFFNKTTGG